MRPFRVCAVIPTYENPDTVGVVARAIRDAVEQVFVVDDASGPAGAAACRELADAGTATLVVRATNGGKGAAVKSGLAAAAAAGFTHALQVDADGQHDLSRATAFVEAARARPDAAVIAYPEYDTSAPQVRLVARKITKFWVDLETGRDVIRDAMVGFRVYPVAETLAVGARGDRMDFDVEVAVRLARAGVPIVNLPVGVRYLRADEGGRSHFQPLRDNLRLSWMHSRICTEACLRWVFRRPARLS
ncbi:MAG: glycosyltransferase family 2 protein [Myxococcales bacterium]|nr:glycosyltransferase family 2 protein [Myxococcales bacterium]MCB9520173.1 glycosyltransferase family 2 protein [Myxococcales bacterium]MCB9531205.1 glycosyltransferase family 2 protein [Myxococcales bacterium]